jgi:hypothetical protein
MNAVLQFLKPDATVKQVTLEALFDRANKIGGVRVYQYKANYPYQVTVTFVRPTGSEIEAKGTDTILSFALEKAIAEALLLSGVTA